MLQYAGEDTSRITFTLPQIHCSSCIWLLEKLPRLHEGILHTRVDFLRKSCTIVFSPSHIPLSGVVTLLKKIGYAPELTLKDLQGAKKPSKDHTPTYRLGLAGFCFGNIMLLSFPEYLSLGELSTQYARFFGYLNLFLSLPVILYSALGYYRSAWTSLRQRHLNMDVPITLGILTLFARSAYEILSQTGAGYLDSLAGLVFFLLIGKWFQNKTYAQLAFDREYGDYFPIAVLREEASSERYVPVTALHPGDIVVIKNEELIPADGILLSEKAQVDYSFVTGESVPIDKYNGETVFAGGKQVGPSVRIQLTRKVAQSYLTQLWEEASPKEERPTSQSLVDTLGKRFTPVILAIALLAGAYWYTQADLGTAINIFSAVLIIACPCALALSSPITLGQTLRLMGRHHFYVKNTAVIEHLARIDHVVLDKTGTITHKSSLPPQYTGTALDTFTQKVLRSLVRESNHPVSVNIHAWVGKGETLPVHEFAEYPGKGIRALIGEQTVFLGSPTFIRECCPDLSLPAPLPQGATLFADASSVWGYFVAKDQYRTGWEHLVHQLGKRLQLSVLSGDNDRERPYLTRKFPKGSILNFNQSPFDKQHYIQELQKRGQQVLMVGDGLNDAGSLRQAEVGIALADSANNFSPACDAILEGKSFASLDAFLRFAQRSIRLIKWSYVLSLSYNVVGISIAVEGQLNPLVAAILMPLSSLSVVLLGSIGSSWISRQVGLGIPEEK